MAVPGLDGKGQSQPGSKTPNESVNVSARTDTPGGESKKGSHIKIEGPNSARKGK
jgi:hypothetical protein